MPSPLIGTIPGPLHVYWFYQSNPRIAPEICRPPSRAVALDPVNQLNAGLLILRVVFGLFLAYHGYNKFFGPGGLKGTAGWFDSIGMRWPGGRPALPRPPKSAAGCCWQRAC